MNKLTYDAGEDFPTLRIGKRLLVVRSKFDTWLEEQSGSCTVF